MSDVSYKKQDNISETSTANEETGVPGISKIDRMAERLADELARHCVSDPWKHLTENERQMLGAVCEGLLMDWSLIIQAHTELIAPE
jgi:hypothetical protein